MSADSGRTSHGTCAFNIVLDFAETLLKLKFLCIRPAALLLISLVLHYRASQCFERDRRFLEQRVGLCVKDLGQIEPGVNDKEH